MKNNTFTDPRDGQVYKTVKIGNQIWLGENFRYKIEGSHVYNDDETYVKKYGRLYSWESAKSSVPPGWRLPTKEDFEVLRTFMETKGFNVFDFITESAGIRNVNGEFSGIDEYTWFWTSSVEHRDEFVPSYRLNRLEGKFGWGGSCNVEFLEPRLYSVRLILN